MKVPPYNIEKFVNTLTAPSKYRGVLLYGEDDGVVSDRESKIVAAFSSYGKRVFYFDAGDNVDEILADLRNEYVMDSFFDSDKILVISDPKPATIHPKMKTDIEELCQMEVDDPGSGRFLLCVCKANLEPKNPLRKLFEDHPSLASLPCYFDNYDSLLVRARECAEKNDMKFASGSLERLVTMFDKNRGAMISEMEKLALYKLYSPNSAIQVSDVEAVVRESSNSSVQDAVNAFFSLDCSGFDDALNTLVASGCAPLRIVSGISGYAFKLVGYISDIEEDMRESGSSDSGSATEGVLGRHKVFFRQIPVVKKHLGIWSSGRIDKLFSKMGDVEFRVKSHPEIAVVVLSQLAYMLYYSFGRR